MVIRYNAQAVADNISARAEPIGVEGDPSTRVRGGVTESEAIVGAAKRSLEGVAGDGRGSNELGRLNTQMILETEEEAEGQEPGPELDPEGLKRARENAEGGQGGLTPEGALSQPGGPAGGAGGASSS